jgi:hypothetical protein
MSEKNSIRSSLSALITAGKELVSLLKDGVLLLILILLILWPKTINTILVEAGFEEGNIAGFKWKDKFYNTDKELVKAQTTIKDIKDQNQKLSLSLSAVKSLIGNAEMKAKIEKLEQLNTEVVASTAKVQASVETSISENAPLVQKIETSTGSLFTWGVVYGGDQTLNSAQDEIDKIAPKLGLTNVAIYYRQGSYRSVAITKEREMGEYLLSKAKKLRKDSYIVNMSSWCPKTARKNGYYECSNK